MKNEVTTIFEVFNNTESVIKLKNTDLELVPVEMPEKYAKHWNERSTDFLALCRNGKPISNSYYRTGGLFTNRGLDFIHILKYVESYYDADLTQETRDNPDARRHLSGQFCLINKKGEETRVFEKFESSYLISNAVYSFKNGYYNCFTNELYCSRQGSVESKTFLFLESGKKVYKVNKQTGDYKIIE